MKYLEVTLFGLSLISLSFFLLYLPGASIFIILQLLALSTIYFYFGFAIFNKIGFTKILKKSSYVNISKFRIFGAIATGISLSIIVLGILFKIMDWPGASFNLLSGLILSMIILFIALFKFSKNKSKYYTFIFSRIGFFGIIASILIFIPTMTFTKIKFRNYPAYLNAYEKAIQDPENEAAWKEVDKQRDLIENP